MTAWSLPSTANQGETQAPHMLSYSKKPLWICGLYTIKVTFKYLTVLSYNEMGATAMAVSTEYWVKSLPFGIQKSKLLALYHCVGEVMSALSVNFAPKFTCPRTPTPSWLQASSVSPAIPQTNSPDPQPFPDSSPPVPLLQPQRLSSQMATLWRWSC